MWPCFFIAGALELLTPLQLFFVHSNFSMFTLTFPCQLRRRRSPRLFCRFSDPLRRIGNTMQNLVCGCIKCLYNEKLFMLTPTFPCTLRRRRSLRLFCRVSDQVWIKVRDLHLSMLQGALQNTLKNGCSSGVIWITLFCYN